MIENNLSHKNITDGIFECIKGNNNEHTSMEQILNYLSKYVQSPSLKKEAAICLRFNVNEKKLIKYRFFNGDKKFKINSEIYQYKETKWYA